jgi:hypothetical protein
VTRARLDPELAATWDAVGALIDAGDAEAVLDLLVGLPPARRDALATRAVRAARRAQRERIERFRIELSLRGRASTASKVADAAAAAAVVCATLEQLRTISGPSAAAEIRCLAARGPEWAEAYLVQDARRMWNGGLDWNVLDALARTGCVRVTGQLVGPLVATLRDRAPKDIPFDALIEHTEWLREAIWGIFEAPGRGLATSPAAYDKYTHTSTGRRLDEALCELSRRDVLDRDRLLDASLAALAREFPAFQAGWFSRFHERLAPTPRERRTRLACYPELLASPNRATQAFAHNAIDQLFMDGELSPAETTSILRAAPPPASAASRARLARTLRRAGGAA